MNEFALFGDNNIDIITIDKVISYNVIFSGYAMFLDILLIIVGQVRLKPRRLRSELIVLKMVKDIQLSSFSF